MQPEKPDWEPKTVSIEIVRQFADPKVVKQIIEATRKQQIGKEWLQGLASPLAGLTHTYLEGWGVDDD